MVSTVSMRLPEGMYFAVKELAEKFETGIAEMAGILLAYGLGSVKQEALSPQTQALLEADKLESQATLLRSFAKMSEDQVKQAVEWLGQIAVKVGAAFEGLP